MHPILETGKNRWRLALLFLATALVPVACLGWLASRVIQEDGQQQRTRIKEQREQAAELAVSAFQRVMAEAEAKLVSFDNEPVASAQDLGSGASLLAIERKGVVARAGTPLLFYPELPMFRDPDPALFAVADELEFEKNDLAAALGALTPLSQNQEPVVSAEALLRIARIQKKLENIPAALDGFSRLEAKGDVLLHGLPASLTARKGRALIFERSGRRVDLEREAATIRNDLESGRWLLSRANFDFAYGEALGWLSIPRTPLDPERLALSEAAESAWSTWQEGADALPNGRGRQAFQVGATSILALTRGPPDRRVVLLMTPRFLGSGWLKDLESQSDGQGIEFGLVDDEGRTVIGPTHPQATSQASRPVPETPWTVGVFARTNEPERGLSSQTKLILTGILMMALLALAAGILVNRAIVRELRVARLQSDFVAAVSHEFRTPLTTLRQLSEMLVKGRVSSDERRHQFYETLLKESDRLQRLVEGLLNFGRMEAGQVKYRFEPINPEEFLQGIVNEFEREISGRGYHIELQGDSSVPAIRADRESLSRVFWNLLDNAVKYSPDSRTVWVDFSNGGRRLAVRVRDRGIGIPRSEQKQIFQKFVRGAASKDASIQGTGVGLAMARQIVAAHGGDISVESRPGEGSVFTVLLPVAES